MRYSKEVVDSAIAQAKHELSTSIHDSGTFWSYVLHILQTQAGM